MTDGEQLAAIARAVIAANRFRILGTADETGLPWVSPVWFAPAGYREFLWVSDPEARHSRNIAVRPELSIVIFDSQVDPGSAQAVYMSALAEELTGPDLEEGIAAFSAYSEAQGAPAWTAMDEATGGVAPSGGAPRSAHLHLYRATAVEQFILDPDATVDRRARVTL